MIKLKSKMSKSNLFDLVKSNPSKRESDTIQRRIWTVPMTENGKIWIFSEDHVNMIVCITDIYVLCSHCAQLCLTRNKLTRVDCVVDGRCVRTCCSGHFVNRVMCDSSHEFQRIPFVTPAESGRLSLPSDKLGGTVFGSSVVANDVWVSFSVREHQWLKRWVY